MHKKPENIFYIKLNSKLNVYILIKCVKTNICIKIHQRISHVKIHLKVQSRWKLIGKYHFDSTLICQLFKQESLCSSTSPLHRKCLRLQKKKGRRKKHCSFWSNSAGRLSHPHPHKRLAHKLHSSLLSFCRSRLEMEEPKENERMKKKKTNAKNKWEKNYVKHVLKNT